MEARPVAFAARDDALVPVKAALVALGEAAAVDAVLAIISVDHHQIVVESGVVPTVIHLHAVGPVPLKQRDQPQRKQ